MKALKTKTVHPQHVQSLEKHYSLPSPFLFPVVLLVSEYRIRRHSDIQNQTKKRNHKAQCSQCMSDKNVIYSQIFVIICVNVCDVITSVATLNQNQNYNAGLYTYLQQSLTQNCQ